MSPLDKSRVSNTGCDNSIKADVAKASGTNNNLIKAIVWLIQFGLLIALLLYNQLTNPLALNSDIGAIFSSNQADNLAKITSKIEQQATRSQIVLVGATKIEDAIAAADVLAAKLQQTAGVASVNVIFEQLPSIESLISDNIAAKHLLLSDKYRALLTENDSDALYRYQFSMLNQVANQAVALSLEQDPSLSLGDFFSRPLVASSGLSPYQDRLISHYDNKDYVFVSFTSAKSGIDIAASQALVANLASLSEQSEVEYLYTGSIFYASEASATGQFEMSLYGGLSLVAMLIMIALVYRNALAIILTLTLIGVSFVYGYLALGVVYDEISVIALVFSVTLIGISADYSFHALTELKHGQYHANKPLATIYSSLIMSYLTTGAGYLVLMLAPFVLFKQIAIFTIFGLLGALITVLLLYPIVASAINSKRAQLPQFIRAINSGHQSLTNSISVRKYLVIPLVLLTLIAGYHTEFNDDIRDFYSVSQTIKNNEYKVKAILKQKWDLQYVLLEASSEQALLEREEAIRPELAELIEVGALNQYSAISQWLPSTKMQLNNLALMQQAQQNGLFIPLNQLLGLTDWSVNQRDNLLGVAQWFESSLGQMYKLQWLIQDDKFYSVIRLSGISDLAAISDKLAPLANVYFVDKASQISQQVTQFRELLLYILAAAVVAAFVVFCLRYGIAVAARAIVSPVFALILALCLSALIQQQLNIFNLVAGVLILALGLDYSVFFAEHGFEQKITLTTLMSGLSSIFVFAILIFSSMPAIQSFGLTVFIGVLIVFVLAPQVVKANIRIQTSSQEK